MFRSLDYRGAGRCEVVSLAGALQDITVDHERRVVYLAELDRDSGRGSVMLLDRNLSQAAPRAAMSRDPRELHPLGIARAGEPARWFAVLSADARDRTPTLVLRYDPRRPDAMPEQVFADDGAPLSAGGSVARWRDQLVIGSLFDDEVLICKTAP